MDRQPAPDFTNAFLVSLAPLIFVALAAIWAAIGFLAALGTSWAADRAVTRIGRARRR